MPLKGEILSEKSESTLKKNKKKLSLVRKAIRKELNACKVSGKPAAIISFALSENTVRSFVEDIYQNGADEVVVVKWYDSNNIPSKTHLFIDEILHVKAIGKSRRSSLTSLK